MTSLVTVSLLNASYTDVEIFVRNFANESYQLLLLFVQLFSFTSANTSNNNFINSNRTSVQSLDDIYQLLLKFTSSFLDFNHFQTKILKVVVSILICNILLISILWQFFGKQICERFMRPATSRAIEELKASVARLKLPKVHSPRV